MVDSELENITKVLEHQSIGFKYINDLKQIANRRCYDLEINLPISDCFLYGIIIGKRLERGKQSATKKKY